MFNLKRNRLFSRIQHHLLQRFEAGSVVRGGKYLDFAPHAVGGGNHTDSQHIFHNTDTFPKMWQIENEPPPHKVGGHPSY